MQSLQSKVLRGSVHLTCKARLLGRQIIKRRMRKACMNQGHLPNVPPTANHRLLQSHFLKVEDEGFKIVHEAVAYERYLRVTDRHVQHPSESKKPATVHAYDVVSSRHEEFCVVFPFHPDPTGKGGEVTLLSEYAQGLHSMAYCLPTGGFDSSKHRSKQECAKQELSEEAHLKDGEYIRLIDPQHPGIPEVKWCTNRFTPFLVIAPEHDNNPEYRDREEYIKIHRLSVDSLKDILRAGNVLPPTTVTCFLALEKLKELGHL